MDLHTLQQGYKPLAQLGWRVKYSGVAGFFSPHLVQVLIFIFSFILRGHNNIID